MIISHLCSDFRKFEIFSDCILKEVTKELKSKKLKCKTPWLFESLIEPSMKECNESEYDQVYKALYDVFSNNLLGLNNCPDICNEVKYKSKARFHAKLSGVEFYDDISEFDGASIVYFFYGKDEATVLQYIPTLSTWGFISSCGGSLGLFLGFSFYNIITFALHQIDRGQN